MDFNNLSEWLSKAPKWAKMLACLIAAAAAMLYLCTSCSTLQRVSFERRMTRDTRDTMRVIVTQAACRVRSTVFATSLCAYDNASKLVGEALPLASTASTSAALNSASSARHRNADAAAVKVRSLDGVNSRYDVP